MDDNEYHYDKDTEDEEMEEPFILENSKYGNLEMYKASAREKVYRHPPSEVSSVKISSIRSDETGHVPMEEMNAKSCVAKSRGTAFLTEDYTKTRDAENQEFISANLHAVESLAPFNLKRVYGRSENVPAINLTGIYRNHIVYATANCVIVFDYVENFQKCLQGHRNAITSLQIEKKGRFIVSADAGKRSLIIIWETLTGKPLKFFPNVHEEQGCIYACFTGMDHIFASIGAEEIGKQTICFWNYEPKNTSKSPILTGIFPKTTSIIKELTFLDGKSEFFAATGDRNVVFGTWIRDRKGDSVYLHKPRLRKTFISKYKRFASSLWMRNGEWLATATGAGYVCIWGPPVVLALEDPPDPTKNIREFQRSFKLCEEGITVFTLLKEYVIVGDEIGIVRFFDHEFKLLRWSRHFALPSILSISFNFTDEVTEFKKNLRARFDEKSKSYLRRENNSRVKDYTIGGKKHRPLSKTTLSRPPMPCPDFVLGVKGGDIYYYHFIESEVDLLVPGSPGPFITCDVCPGSNHVAFGTAKGEIQMYDFKTHQLIFSDKIFSGNHRINTMKFHPMGQFVAFGLGDGHVCFRQNYTWKTAIPPMFLTKNQVIRILYTSDGLHLAYFDSNSTVVVLKYLPKGHGWMILGKSRAHKQTIADLQVFLDPEQGQNRLFSLGFDRHLIEYDLDRSSEESGLFIVKITNLEQTARPTAMVVDGPLEFGIDCITFANDINKIRLFAYKEEKVKRTCSGPVFGRDKGIKRMVEFPTYMSENRFKKFIVYIVRNKLGMMDTPLDGNPHKYMAVYTHPKEIIEVAVVPDKERIFTIGKDDNSGFVWEASPRAVEATVLMGGSGVTPFYHTLRRHWGGACQDIIKDLDMIFFFLNVKRIDKQTELYTMNRNIRLCEIAAVCRACGFYPSEYEVGLMMDEARRYKQADQHYSDDTTTEYSFDEFVKLFVNHFYRTTDEDLEEAFKTLGFLEPEDEYPYICRHDFIKYLTEEGEPIKEYNFPIFFEQMYDIREPGEFGDVKCHTVQEVSESSSYSSINSASVSSTETETKKESGESGSDTSTYSNPENEIEEQTEQKEAPDDGNEEQGLEDHEIHVKEENIADNRAESRKSVLVGNKKSLGGSKSVTVLLLKDDEEQEVEFEKVSDEDENETAEVPGEDDLIDIPERIDLLYFLETMIPPDSQQTIRWKSKLEKDKDQSVKDEFFVTKMKQEKEFLNSLLKQIVDPNFPIPRKLLNALYAEYYLEHGDFSVPPDLRYPGIRLPDNSWYLDSEWEGEAEGESASATSQTYTSSYVTTGTTGTTGLSIKDGNLEDEANIEGEDEDETNIEGEDEDETNIEGEDEDEANIEGEYEGQGQANSEGETENHGESEGEYEDVVSGLLEEKDHDLEEDFGENEEDTQNVPVTSTEYYETEDFSTEQYGEEENEGAYSPPFTVSDNPETATDSHIKNDYETDGTEEMTDLDNIYDQEDLAFVKSVSKSFLQKNNEGDKDKSNV